MCPAPAGLTGLVDELQARLQGGKQLVEATDMSSPVKVAYAVKQLAKEASVGGQRAGQL